MESEKRIKILRALEKDSRISNADLAMQFGLSEEEIVKEIKLMEKEGIIAGYNTLIDWEKVGVEKVIAHIQVKVCPQKDDGFAKIAQKICKYNEVYDLTLISGDYDFVVTLQGSSLQEIANFVHTKLAPIDGVTATATNFILEKYKENGKDYSKKIGKGRIVVAP